MVPKWSMKKKVKMYKVLVKFDSKYSYYKILIFWSTSRTCEVI